MNPGLCTLQAFVVSFKGVFLEGLEVVFIVITFGLSATRYNPHGLLVASASAVLAGLLVVVVGIIARRPLSAVLENTMKYAVGLLLTSFGTFWAVEGLGYFGSGESLTWPGQDWAILGLVVGGLGLSRLAVAGPRRVSETPRIVEDRPAVNPGISVNSRKLMIWRELMNWPYGQIHLVLLGSDPPAQATRSPRSCRHHSCEA